MFYFFLALFVAAASAAPLNDESVAPVLRSDSNVGPADFSYAYETGNGISAQASGELKKVDADAEALVHNGQYAYDAPDGQSIKVNYVADELGYHPQGDHLPTPPPTPEPILRALKYIQEHPAPVTPLKFQK